MHQAVCPASFSLRGLEHAVRLAGLLVVPVVEGEEAEEDDPAEDGEDGGGHDHLGGHALVHLGLRGVAKGGAGESGVRWSVRPTTTRRKRR